MACPHSLPDFAAKSMALPEHRVTYPAALPTKSMRPIARRGRGCSGIGWARARPDAGLEALDLRLGGDGAGPDGDVA